ncbi:hypothetical protein BD289DRAFT_375628, partial [Coniella lustricola]
EAFLLFAQSFPSQNLGFIDSKASSLDISINGRDLTITQSPAILSSNRANGTTGAVVWKVTPLFASWLASSKPNILFRNGVLSSASIVLELGCGVSALVGLATSPLVHRYLLTDQPYVARFVEQNIIQNSTDAALFSPSTNNSNLNNKRKAPSSGSSASKGANARANATGNLTFHPLDWELDTLDPATLGIPNLVVACDCVYNDALIVPLVQSCVDACRLQLFSSAFSSSSSPSGHKERAERNDEEGSIAELNPCVCVVAQQLRAPEVFEAWLSEFMRKGFRVWRMPDAELPEGLRSTAGFVVHVGILREAYG